MEPSTEIQSGGQSKGLSQFAPGFVLRSEAHRMPFHALLGPERKAVMELLARMTTILDLRSGNRATAQNGSGLTDEYATGFLISGHRGTGKTTVLLSARYAFEDPANFFARMANGSPNEAPADFDRERVERVAPGVIWLDALDMQQLPPNANLLTMLLVSLRDALDRGSGGRPESRQPRGRSAPPPNVLAQETDDVWQMLLSLIHSATVMWEPVVEQDPLRRANVQIDVADTYATFRRDFREAVERVARTVRPIGSRSQAPVLVLPIDNADRTIEHVYSILKLIQMASCPSLWYFLAGSQSDLDIFVERSFRDELRVAEFAAGSEGSIVEKMLGIARRQAASTVRTVLPPSHRITIECVEPEGALDFTIDKSQKTLLELLDGIRTSSSTRTRADGVLRPTDKAEPKKATGNQPETLLDYFVLDRFLSDTVRRKIRDAESRERTEEDRSAEEGNGNGAGEKRLAKAPRTLSQAGEWALMLPMRHLIDLWQNARFRSETQNEEGAVSLVHDILDNLIAESELSPWASSYLRNEVIVRNAEGEICLDFNKNPIHWDAVFRTRNRFALPPQSASERNPSERIVSYLKLNDFHGFKLKLQWGNKTEMLPDLVAGWFMILYDLLKRKVGARINESRVEPTDVKNLYLVETQHEALVWGSEHPLNTGYEMVVLRFNWRVPAFESFFDLGLLATQWRAFIQHAVPRGKKVPADGLHRHFIRYLMAAWIDNIRSIAVPSNHKEAPASWTWEDAMATGDELMVAAEKVENYEKQLRVTLARLYEEILGQPWDAAERIPRVLEWLESDLLLSGLPEYLGTIEPPHDSWRGRLYSKWENNRLMLSIKRFRRVRHAIEDSEVYKKFRGSLGAAGSCCQELAWLQSAELDACGSWFKLLDRLFSTDSIAHRWRPEPADMPNAWWPLPIAHDRSAGRTAAGARP